MEWPRHTKRVRQRSKEPGRRVMDKKQGIGRGGREVAVMT